MTLHPAPRPASAPRPRGTLEALAVVAAGALVAPPAGAAAPVCPIVLDDTRGEGWQTAVSRAAARLAELARKSQVDCRSIEVHPNAEPPEVVFVTGDGRRAVRSIASPEELADAVDALAVTFMVQEAEPAAEPTSGAPDETPPPVAAKPEVTKPAPAVAAATPAPPSTQPPVTPQPDALPTELELVGEVGFRGGRSTGSPIISGGGTLELGRFEFGIAAQWETGYVGFEEEAADGKSASGVGTRLQLGARLHQSSALRVSMGVSLGAASVELTGGESPPAARSDDSLEARLGAYASARTPGTGRVGMRAGVAGEWTPSSLRTNEASPLPTFTLLGTLGFEVDVP